MGAPKNARDLTARLVRATGARALVVDYRLAPEHPFPAAIEDATAAYRWLLASGITSDQIGIGGDSAGGGLTMTTLLTLRDAGDPLPAAALLLSPHTDLAGTGASLQTRAEFDPWLSPELVVAEPRHYLAGTDPRHPLVSPIYADLHGLPPVLILVGHDECLLDDSVRLAPRSVTLLVTGIFHTRDGDEDLACADYLAALLRGERPDTDAFARRVRESDFGRQYTDPTHPATPAADLDYCAVVDRFDFAMPVARRDGLLVMRPVR